MNRVSVQYDKQQKAFGEYMSTGGRQTNENKRTKANVILLPMP